jgi:TPR repeat protein
MLVLVAASAVELSLVSIFRSKPHNRRRSVAFMRCFASATLGSRPAAVHLCSLIAMCKHLTCPTQVSRFFFMAASQGLVAAHFRLGVMHFGCKGVDQYLTAALQLLTQAAKQHHPKAACRRACMHEKDCGVATDAAVASEWCARAAAGGCIEMMQHWAQMRDRDA